MKKKLLMFILICLIAFVGGCGCNTENTDKLKPSKTYDNEVDTLIMSSQELDGVFNPFFSTSAADGNVVGMTQIGMLGNDESGNYTYGPDEPVVVNDLGIVEEGSKAQNNKTTTYYFVLKRDVKFSNGSPLTMKDVLFNLYVYLDPVYTGSSTIYSTDIVGLKEYQTQQDDPEAQKRFKDQFVLEANQRINNIVAAANDIFDQHKESMDLDQFKQYLADFDTDGQMTKDLDAAVELFKEELNDDMKTSIDTADTIKFTNKFGTVHENWLISDVQAFLYNENYISYNKEEDRLESSLVTNVSELSEWTQEQAINAIISDKIPTDIAEILTYWQTGTKLRENLTNEALSAYNDAHPDVKYPNISGIQFANRTQPVTFRNEVGVEKTYGVPTYAEDGSVNNDTYEVLKIVINDVDPKAIWNFGFSVAPMYYYSSPELIEKFDYFSNFGVKRSDPNFMETVVKNKDKIGVPVGAGPYQASKASGGTDNIKGSDFKDNNIIYFERNPYYIGGAPLIKKIRFQVVPQNQMTNALYTNSIDYVEPNAKTEIINELNGKRDQGFVNQSVRTAGYGYIGINAHFVPTLEVRQVIMHLIDTQEVVNYYGSKATAIYRSMSLESWAYPKNCTPYYPYLYGPIPAGYDKMTSSKLNPAYKEFALSKGKGTDGTATFTDEEVREFVKLQIETVAGYRLNGNGVYQKGSDVLKYTFTIAGEEEDHPAWNALYHAGTILNSMGFQINVTTDKWALSKLASGDLTVWAAAWGGTIDPDMYQVYHMESNATSVNNWGYKDIKNNIGGKYNRELRILEELSEKIDEGRETTVQKERIDIYSDALDYVMQLAVELPTYQRDDLFAYNGNKIDGNTLNQNCTAYKGLTSDLHKISLKIS